MPVGKNDAVSAVVAKLAVPNKEPVNDVAVTPPTTCKVFVGVIVPIPTFPAEVIRIRSVLFVENDRGKFSLISIPPIVASNTICKPSPDASPVESFFSANLACPAPPFIANVIPEAPVGLVVPMPTLPLSNTTKLDDALLFSTRNAVVAEVAPLPFISNFADGELSPIPTKPVEPTILIISGCVIAPA